MTARDHEDRELLARAASDPDAFAAFYRRYSHAIFAFFMSRFRRAELAADLTGETFAAALAAIGARPVPDHPRAWLYGIAANHFADTLRKQRVSDDARCRLAFAPIELTDAELERTEALVDLAAEAERLRQLLSELPPQEADALRARIVDERDYTEIAHQLACSEAVIRKRVSRGLARLRSAMEADP